MLLAVDVDYKDDGSAVAAGVLFQSWASATIEDTVLRTIASVQAYQPGRFFERELPCILAVADQCSHAFEAIIIDGYVYLGDQRRDGLGAHLFRALGETTPIVGVAKSKFSETPAETEVLRGTSTRPLYVTSAGISGSVAKQNVQSMHGDHRIPTMLSAADRACRRSP